MIEINNLSGKEINGNFSKKVCQEVLKGEAKKIDLSVAFLKSEAVKKLNKKYREKDKPTDVLSFLYGNSGEIIICPEVVAKNAKKTGSNFKKELTLVLIHGILHLLGYDHEKNAKKALLMEKKQESYLSRILK